MSKKPRQIDGWQVKGEKVGVGQVGVAWDIYPGLIDWRVFYLGSGGSFSCWQGRCVCGRDAVWVYFFTAKAFSISRGPITVLVVFLGSANHSRNQSTSGIQVFHSNTVSGEKRISLHPS